MLAWPRSRQIPTRSEPIRWARPRSVIGFAESSSIPGKTGARFSIAIVTPEPLGPLGEPRQRAGLELQRGLGGGVVG